jgi:hypothetical protein
MWHYLLYCYCFGCFVIWLGIALHGLVEGSLDWKETMTFSLPVSFLLAPLWPIFLPWMLRELRQSLKLRVARRRHREALEEAVTLYPRCGRAVRLDAATLLGNEGSFAVFHSMSLS